MPSHDHPTNDFDDIETLQKVAYLARLAIPEAELPRYGSTLSKLLGLVGQINDSDTANIAPMAHPFADLKQLMRPDEVTEQNLITLFQAIAPLKEADLYLVPKII